MIQLHPDYLLFQTSTGEAIPCSAELVTVELIGDAAAHLDPEVIQHAASAVLHYFKHDLGQTVVSVAEFSSALEKVLTKLGLDVRSGEPIPAPNVITSDLRKLAGQSSAGLELGFFPSLRDELRNRLQKEPQILRFNGLRGCVKELTGAKRWNSECQRLSDQIVDYLRKCLATEPPGSNCSVVIE